MESLVSAGWLVAPWQIQAALASGYTAYMAAYTGIRGHHQAIDTTFRALAFGLVATLVLAAIPASHPVWAVTGAFMSSLVAGLLWRRFGAKIWEALLRRVDVSWGDDTPSAWRRMLADQRHYLKQIAVLTTDDRWIKCDDAERFRDQLDGPCLLGEDGDVLIYATHIKDANGEREVNATVDPNWGARATYLPASQIKQVNIRRVPIGS